MSWQRIGQNTFIDESLVTCAEYQLFIDEMLDQGKYYQPDHWSAYQFPEGHALKPVLGLRYGDVEVFCAWLTEREGGEWYYRPPDYLEAQSYPIMSAPEISVGNWKRGNSFEWIGERHQYSSLSRFISMPLDLDDAYRRAVLFAEILEKALQAAQKDAYAQSRTRIVNLAHGLKRDLSFSSSRALDRSLADALDVVSTLTENPSLDVGLYNDLLTLEMRIAGRAPAVEGIRLVKERK